jgi:hypothetical protein
MALTVALQSGEGVLEAWAAVPAAERTGYLEETAGPVVRAIILDRIVEFAAALYADAGLASDPVGKDKDGNPRGFGVNLSGETPGAAYAQVIFRR